MTYAVRPISDRTPFTGRRRPSPFESTWSRTETLLLHELRALSARNAVLEVDVLEGQIRLDGRMKSNARVASPCVRLAFDSSHGPLTYATDRFPTWQDNVRAIALGLEALRKVDRYGITERGEQYTGFKALPAGRAMPASHMTRTEAENVLLHWGGAEGDLAAQYRRARAAAHPDRHEGDRAAWDRVEQAANVLGASR